MITNISFAPTSGRIKVILDATLERPKGPAPDYEVLREEQHRCVEQIERALVGLLPHFLYPRT